MIPADSLSRRYNLCPDTDNDNTNLTLLPEDLFVRAIDMELQNSVLHAQLSDSTAKEAIRLATGGIGSDPSRNAAAWTTEVDGNGQRLVFFNNRLYIPDDQDLRRKIVSSFHDAKTAGHPGILATTAAVARDHYWPGLRSFVRRYVQGCAPCQQFKINRHPTKPALQPIPSYATRPFSQVATDFITHLPQTDDGYDSIMVVVDHGLSKGIILIPTSETGLSAEKTSNLYIKNVYSRFGLPEKVISDRGPQFDSRFWQEFCKALEIKSSMTTTFHPQADGNTE